MMSSGKDENTLNTLDENIQVISDKNIKMFFISKC